MAVLRADTFNRANGSLIGSTPSDSGDVWAGSGTWAIVSNQGAKTASFSVLEFVYLEASASDVDVIATLATAGNSGLCGRMTDASNGIYGRASSTNGFFVYRWEAGSATELASNTGFVAADGDVITLSFSGDNIVLKQNGTARVTTSSSFNNTATKHGIGDFGNVASYWDGFSVETASAGGGPLTGGPTYSILTKGRLVA